MNQIRNALKTALTKYPVLSNSVIYGSLCIGAELSQQTLNKKILAEVPEPLDTGTLARFAVYGTGIAGPIFSVWYAYLDRKFVGTALKTVGKKMVVDQFFFTPQILVVFYIVMSAMEGKKDLLAECKQKFLPTFQSSCLFWIPVQAVNFIFVPPMFRVTYIGSCSFIWVNILCWIKRQALPELESPESNVVPVLDKEK